MASPRVAAMSILAACASMVSGTAGAQAPEPPASGGLARRVELTPAEQTAQASAYLDRMVASRYRVQRDLAEARMARDVVQALCISDKLTQIDVAIRSARDRRETLLGAVARGDVDLAHHELTILTVLRERTALLAAEAEQCLGNRGPFEEGTSVELVGEEDLRGEEVVDYPADEVIVEPPGCSSCFK